MCSENNLQSQRSLIFLENSISEYCLLLKTTKFAFQNGGCRGSYDFASVFDYFGGSFDSKPSEQILPSASVLIHLNMCHRVQYWLRLLNEKVSIYL